MGKRQPAPLGDALRRLRQELDLTEGEMGKPIDASGKVIYNKEKGYQGLSREEVEAMVRAQGLPDTAIEMALAFGRWLRAVRPPPEPLAPEQGDLRRSEHLAGLYGLEVSRAVLPVLARRVNARRIERDRRRAAERGKLLLRLATDRERRERIEDAEDYQTWALVEWLAHASKRAAANKPGPAVELAELALFVVQFVPGPDCRRKRLDGYGRFYLGNAFRVRNDLDDADAAFERAWASWKAGEEDDFLPLEEWRILDLEASLLREHRRFPEALDRLARALEISPSESKGRILLKKASTLEQKEDIEAAIEALRQARPHVESSGNRRDIFGLRFNLAVALLHLSRFSAAEDLFSEVHAAAVELGNELDLVRTLWLRARIDAGLGRILEAIAGFERVFGDLMAHDLPYDLALVGLDLAVLYLEQGRTRDVLPLALQMEAVFRSKGVEREALAALLVFCEAARRGEATIELARKTAEVIEKVQGGKIVPPLPEGVEEGGERGG